MKQQREIRKHWLTIRLNDEEQEELNRLFAQSTCRGISDYVRKVILNKPINIRYRNASVDDFLADMLLLKKELNSIGNNFNQAVHKLHTLDHIASFQPWLLSNETDKQKLFEIINRINSRTENLYSLWSQK